MISDARRRSGLSLRELAARAGTSHSAIAAYEHGRTSPTVATLTRVLRAAGYVADVDLVRRIDANSRVERGAELAAVLELAAMFPARHRPTLDAPVFGRPGS